MAKNTAYLHGIFKDVTRVNQFVIDSDRVLHRYGADSNVRTGVNSALCKYEFLMVIHFHIVFPFLWFSERPEKYCCYFFAKTGDFSPVMLVSRFCFLLIKSFLLDLMCDILLLYSPKYNSTTEERRQNEHSKHIHTDIS